MTFPLRSTAACAALLAALWTGAAPAQENATARPPVVAPGLNAVIEKSEPAGWSSVKDIDALTDPKALTAAQGKWWRDEARRMQALPAGGALKAARSGPVLMLALRGGRALKLFDQGVPGAGLHEGDRFHTLAGASPAAGHYVVQVSMNEFEFHWLVSHATGAMASVPAKPVFTPDAARAFGFRDELMNGRELGVVALTPEGGTPEKVEWKPGDEPDVKFELRWAPDGQAILVSETRAGKRVDYRLARRDGAWRRQ
ncbi:MAG: hypothetical protein IPK81_11350 [Rhodospirillales bacterium]|nr:MAG: hypothetical protein IPK81_11350 [Rhodospirillales bacterium]